MSPSEKSIDLSLLEQLRNPAGEPGTDIVEKVIRIFLANTPAFLVSIEEAMKKKDYAQMARTAHKLKSSCANIGAQPLTRLLDQIEFFDEGSAVDRVELIKSIQIEIEKIQTILIKTLEPS